MLSSLSLFIGRRFSRTQRRNVLVSFISLSSTIGIAVGVMVVILGLSAMNGFERELNNRILSVIPHGELEGVEAPIFNWQGVKNDALKNPQIIGAAPYVKFTALLEKGSRQAPAELRGIVPDQENQVSSISSFIDRDGWQSLKNGDDVIVLGKGIADKLEVGVGDWVTAMLPSPDPELRLKAPKRIRMKVTGILSLGGQIDHSLALISLADGQKNLNLGHSVSGVSLKMKDPFQAREVMGELRGVIKEYVYLRNWTTKFGSIFRDIQMVRAIMYLVMVLMISVASFNIVSTLMMAVKDRTSEIAILRTLGAEDRLIKSIFVWHGVMSGIAGSLIGCALGSMLALNLTVVMSAIENAIGHKFLSGGIYFIDFLPTQLNSTDLLVVSLTAITLSLLATWYPSRRACQLNPASVLSAK
ncbi:lipoprotein-releasing system transmembrane subunit LolE [Veronia nyctiphanis]|uniref:Lipoprotein-releasing system transmembrane subunit LolE n=1 Tax=Veronia nyctiphanis TaxID=1278244 RepID=A0A4Q0YQT2_9GAMM|nr:lipoprotein-releasing ABC transporter permease subunit LolE [Veronia nyctiphanis]RXJ72424.1 lipoprotein-releasing system transmembrane subunit LolE [Veronia nyctiphanis]